MDTVEESHILRLPPEIVEKIFRYASLQGEELCSLSRTCSTFRDVLLMNELWRIKFIQRWPELQPYLQTLAKEYSMCWKSLYRDRILLKKDITVKLKELSYKTHHGEDKALLIMEEGNFYNFGVLPFFLQPEREYLSHEQKLMLIASELLEVYLSGDKRQNLNARYFAEKSLFYIQHTQLETDVKAYASRTMEEKDIEEGSFLIAKWFQPTLSFTLADIKEKFDKLAATVKAALYEIYPSHPVFTRTSEIPQPSKLRESLWNIHDCRLIISAIEQTLKPLLMKDVQQYYVAENSFINLVLDCYKGIPITLSLVVSRVASRLGMVLEPVNFPRHFLLRWMERPARTGVDRYTFIDVFSGDYSLTFSNLVENFSEPGLPVTIHCADSCSIDIVLQRMIRNLVAHGRHSNQGGDMMMLHHACQLFLLFFPQDANMNLLEVQIQLHLGINLPKAMCAIEEIASEIPWMHARLSQLESKCQYAIEQVRHKEKGLEIKKRSDYKEVQYSVGMVMRHRRYDYLCVIYGWDNKCKASQDWIRQMGVNKQQEKEPFYNVLVMDGSNRYAWQENLQFTMDTCEITHPMVGLYFDSFNGRYYIPCDSVQEQYPEDGDVTHRDVTQFFDSQLTEEDENTDMACA